MAWLQTFNRLSTLCSTHQNKRHQSKWTSQGVSKLWSYFFTAARVAWPICIPLVGQLGQSRQQWRNIAHGVLPAIWAYCCQGYLSCLVHLITIGSATWAIWITMKKYSSWCTSTDVVFTDSLDNFRWLVLLIRTLNGYDNTFCYVYYDGFYTYHRKVDHETLMTSSKHCNDRILPHS